jgi:predicted nucleotide-binding protein
MKRTTRYPRTVFTAEAIKEATDEFDRQFRVAGEPPTLSLNVAIDEDEWSHEFESEFFSDYRRNATQAALRRKHKTAELGLLLIDGRTTIVSVDAPERARIQAIFEIFARYAPMCQIPEPPKKTPRIFIGHGRNDQCRDLKDHLHEKHGYDVEAYEVGARAGHSVCDVLEQMLNRSAFALLVLTAEDETADGSLRARQNVIHETGLFQGRLGFHRAIVLVEQGAEEFSNIAGIEQIRFGEGRIRETFGDVLATLKREFE